MSQATFVEGSSMRSQSYELLLSPPQISPLLRSEVSSKSVISKWEDSLDIQSASTSQETLKVVVRTLSIHLRDRHRTEIEWPSESVQTSINAYHCEVFINPVLHLFSQLCPNIFSNLHSAVDIPAPGSSNLSFTLSNPFDRSNGGLAYHNLIAAARAGITGSTHHHIPAVEGRLAFKPQGKDICSDFTSIIVFHPPASSDDLSGIVYERREVKNNLSAVRIIFAAYLYDNLSSIGALGPRTRTHNNPNAHPQGCVIDPSIPLSPDKVVFRTHRRHLDFDLYSAVSDRARALQFFRWKEHMTKSVTRPTKVGDILSGRTNGFIRHHLPLKPYFPIKAFSPDILDHINSVQRPSPLEDEASRNLASSNEFMVELLEDLTPEPSIRQCTIYRCRLISIDGDEVASPGDLCVKLFDDRFVPMMAPEGVILNLPIASWWFFRYESSEDTIRYEQGAYDRLKPLQGSLIPAYFGAHTFTLSDGHTLGGILLEYVKAQGMDKLPVALLPEEEQVSLVKSTRLAVRALQQADVSQHDWHAGQILCHQHVQGLHCVLIDFARATFTVDPDIRHWADDVSDCLNVLCDDDEGVRLNKERLYKHFRWREPWDTNKSYVPDEVFETPDPFAFAYEVDGEHTE